MKTFGLMRGSEEERQRLINSLKKVRDPHERTRVLWALEGIKKDSSGVARSERPKEPPEAPQQMKMRLPIEMPKGIGLLTKYAAPFILIIFGLAFILQAVLRGLQGKGFGPEIGQFITGAMFLIFGVVALQKAKKILQTPEESGKEKIPQ